MDLWINLNKPDLVGHVCHMINLNKPGLVGHVCHMINLNKPSLLGHVPLCHMMCTANGTSVERTHRQQCDYN